MPELYKRVFFTGGGEETSRLVMRALLWGLYLPKYPELCVEPCVADRYRPDVMALGEAETPVFWGEAGILSVERIHEIANRFRAAHFVIACWEGEPVSMRDRARKALRKVHRDAPVDVTVFPADSYARFIDAEGIIRIARDDLLWERMM